MWLWMALLTVGCIGMALLLTRMERVRIRPLEEGPRPQPDDGHVESTEG